MCLLSATPSWGGGGGGGTPALVWRGHGRRRGLRLGCLRRCCCLLSYLLYTHTHTHTHTHTQHDILIHIYIYICVCVSMSSYNYWVKCLKTQFLSYPLCLPLQQRHAPALPCTATEALKTQCLGTRNMQNLLYKFAYKLLRSSCCLPCASSLLPCGFQSVASWRGSREQRRQ